MKIRLYQHLNKCLNSWHSSDDLLIYNILINMHIYNFPFKWMINTWLCWAKILSSRDHLVLFWIQEIPLLCDMIFNWIVLHAGPIFYWTSCLTENIFKNHTRKCSLCHIGTKQVNISDYFFLVMSRPFEKCIL